MFKPYKIIPTKRLSCIYGYRNNEDEVVIDRTYESDSYNYLEQSWWKEITPMLSKENKLGWSKPYLESIGSEELMTTVGAAIYDGDEIVGISTVDWKISSVVNTIAQMKPTPNSFALFADTNNDYIIVSSDKYLADKNLLGKSLKEIPWYDTDLKNKADVLFETLGLNIETALNIFLRQSVREGRIPFEVTLNVPNSDTISAMTECLCLLKDENVKTYDVDDALKVLKAE